MVSCWFYFSDGFFSSLFLLGAYISETFCAPFACFAKQDQHTNGHTKGLIHSFFFLFFYIVFQQNKQTFIVVIGENLRFSIFFFHVILHSITLKVNWNRPLYAHYSKLLTLFCHPFASLFRWFALFLGEIIQLHNDKHCLPNTLTCMSNCSGSNKKKCILFLSKKEINNKIKYEKESMPRTKRRYAHFFCLYYPRTNDNIQVTSVYEAQTRLNAIALNIHNALRLFSFFFCADTKLRIPFLAFEHIQYWTFDELNVFFSSSIFECLF